MRVAVLPPYADTVIGYIMTHACYKTGLPVASSTASRLA
jgi:hypothetical protein